MRSFAPFRLAAQLCFCAAVLCLFAPFQANWPMFALLPVLAFAAALAAVGCHTPWLRLILGLAPLLALPLASGWLSIAAALLAAVYTAATLTAGRFVLELWQYRREVLALVSICAAISLISNLAAFHSLPTRCFSAACILLAFLALRALRMRRAASAAWEAGNPGLFLLPLAGAAGLGAGLWASIPLFRYAAQGLAALMAGLLSLWNAGWAWLMSRVHTVDEDFFEEKQVLPEEWFGEASPSDLTVQNGSTLRLPEVRFPWLLLLAVLAGIPLVILAIRLLRRGKRPLSEEIPEDFAWEEVPTGAAPVRSRRRRRTAKTNRSRIRSIYREYLAYLRIQGIPHRVSETTADVTESTRALLVETDELLRDLYRKARYSSAEISPEELRLAEERLHWLTSKANLRETQ